MGGDHAPDRRSRRQQMILADDLAQYRRAQPISQRARRLGLEECGHARRHSRARHSRAEPERGKIGIDGNDSVIARGNLGNPAQLCQLEHRDRS